MTDNKDCADALADTDPEVQEALKAIIREKAERMSRELLDVPEPVIGHSKKRFPRIQKARKSLFVTALLAAVVAAVFVACANHWSFVFGAISVLLGLAVFTIVFAEVTIGAGEEIETEYKRGDEYSRQFRFVPSITGVGALLRILGVGFMAVILGFAAFYAAFSRYAPESFSERISAVSAIYFSCVTFATVGYGDVAPRTDLTRAIVTVEILSSLLTISVLITVTISWVVGHLQRQHDEFISRRTEATLRREEIMRRVGIGVYGESREELLELAKKRVREKRESATKS